MEPGSLIVSGNDGRISPRIVSVTTAKKGYMAPVVKGPSGMEQNSLVTWLSISGRPVSKANDEEVSASEGEVSASDSSCYSTPMVHGNKHANELLIKSALRK